MMGGFRLGGGDYHEPEKEKREDELGEGLSEWEHSEYPGLSEQELSENPGLNEQELSRLRTTTAQRVFWIVVGIALLLFLIVMIVGANVFHW